MFSNLTPTATLPVSDLDRARRFYEGTLGLTPDDRMGPMGIIYKCGSGSIFVYPSEYAGTNKGTAVGFDVSEADFDAEVDNLRKQGVTFQTFDAPDMEWKDDVALMGEFKSVWFADPDGNIINIANMGL